VQARQVVDVVVCANAMDLPVHWRPRSGIAVSLRDTG